MYLVKVEVPISGLIKLVIGLRNCQKESYGYEINFFTMRNHYYTNNFYFNTINVTILPSGYSCWKKKESERPELQVLFGYFCLVFLNFFL